jgi:hypothetical protein
MAAALPAIALVSAGLSAGGAVLGGISQSNAAHYQAQVAKNNATIANQNADYAEQAGVAKSEAAGQQAAAQLGAVKASIAANGVDVNSGSALTVQQSQRGAGELSQQATVNDALLQAYGFRTQATSDTAQAGLYQSESESAIPASLLSATGDLAKAAPDVPAAYSWMTSSSSAPDSSIGFRSGGVY